MGFPRGYPLWLKVGSKPREVASLICCVTNGIEREAEGRGS